MCDHVQALLQKIIRDEKEAMTLNPLSSECIDKSTLLAVINGRSGGISHPRVNKGVKSVDHPLKRLNKHARQ